MAYESDYIKRSFSFIRVLVTRLVAMVRDGYTDIAKREISEIYSEFFGLPPTLLHYFPANEIVYMLSTSDGRDEERVLSLAELLKLEGEIYQNEKDFEEAQWRFDLALELLVEGTAGASSAHTLELIERFQPVVRFSMGNEIALELLADLYRLYADSGNFGLAMELLTAFIAADEAHDEGKKEAAAFCLNLLNKSDAELEDGGVSRQEIKNALEQVSKFTNPLEIEPK